MKIKGVTSYSDYKQYKSELTAGLDRETCALFNTLCMVHLYQSERNVWEADVCQSDAKLLEKIYNTLVQDDALVSLKQRSDVSKLVVELNDLGVDDDGNPDDFEDVTIQLLGCMDYALSEVHGAYQDTIFHTMEIMTDRLDAQLDEIYPDYMATSLENMFSYPEAKVVLQNMTGLVEEIRRGGKSLSLVSFLRSV